MKLYHMSECPRLSTYILNAELLAQRPTFLAKEKWDEASIVQLAVPGSSTNANRKTPNRIRGAAEPRQRSRILYTGLTSLKHKA